MLTMKAKYALKALAFLARSSSETPVLSAKIAEEENIPHKFLEMIMGELRQHGFVQSRKGKGGGYTLRKTPQQISLADVIRIFDGPIAPVPCLSKTAYRRCEECADPTTCAVRLVLRDPHEALLSAFEETTIADMVALENEAKAGIQRAPLRYSI